MEAVVIIIIVISLVLAGVVTVATAARKEKKQCACYEFVGDNPNCLVREHRNMARAYERIRRRSGLIPGRK